MKFRTITTMLLTLTCGITSTRANTPFQNLDFEQAVVTPAPPNYTPGDAAQPISSAAALPHWQAYADNNLSTALWGAPIALDETSLALVSSNAMQGQYGLQFYAWGGSNQANGYFHSVSISQTADLPADAQSIRFLLRRPAVAGASGPNSLPTVMLNGVAIPLFQLSSANGISTWGGNVSAFAGTNATLTFAAFDPDPHPENIFELDAISFSPQAVPEATSLLLLLPSLLGLAQRRSVRRSTSTSFS